MSAAADSSQFWGPRFALIAFFLTAIGLVAGFSQAVTFLTIFGFLAAFVGLVYPALGVLAVGLLSTLDPLTRVYLMSGGLLRWNSLNYLLIAMLIVFYYRAFRMRDTPTLILIGFTFLLIAHLTFTPDVAVGSYNVLNVVAALGLTLVYIRAGRDHHLLYWTAIANGLIAGLGGLIYFMQIAKLPMMNKNAWSAFPLTALFSICLAFPFASRGWRGKVSLGLLALVNSLWIFFSGSRGALLIGAFCLVFLVLQLKGAAQKIWSCLLAVTVTLTAFAIFGDQQNFAFHRIEKLFDTSRALESRTSGRSDLAIAGWYIFKDNPLGVGTGGFGSAYSKLVDNDLSFSGRENLAHSAWVKTLAENGVIGLLVLAAYVGSFAAIGWKKRRLGFLPLGVLVTLAIGSAFFSREFQSKGLWLLAAGFIAMAEYGGLAGSPALAGHREAWARRFGGVRMKARLRRPQGPVQGPERERPAPVFPS